MKKTIFLYFLPIMAFLFLASCDAGNKKSLQLPEGEPIELRYADNLTMTDYGDFVKATFRNPWDTTKTLQTFLLVPRDREIPANLPEGTVIRTPIRKSVVYTSVHNSLIEELGALDAITGICDTKYIYKEAIRKRIDNGDITDCGTSMAPNIEKILMLNPDAILLSAFENSNDHNKVGQIGIPIIDCIDYMETSPLARAEWMRFFGRLYGKGETADSIFNETEKAYNSIKESAKTAKTRPVIMTDMIYGQSWNVPGAISTTGVLIEDAGGVNPFATFRKSGSVQLAPEEVLYRAKDADVWLLKYSQDIPVSITQLGKDNSIYTKFRPYTTGNIYGCNTDKTSYFEEAAFHPHWILAEYVELFHPETGSNEHNHHYYIKLER